MYRKTILVSAAALALAACTREPVSAPDGPELLIGGSPLSPIELTYVKTETGPGTAHWTGAVSGDFSGDLATQVLSVKEAGHIWHIETLWEVAAGPQSFSAELNGTLDTKTGTLVLTGEIVSGAMTGAQVYDEGQLVGTDSGTGGTVFEGFLRIMTSSGK